MVGVGVGVGSCSVQHNIICELHCHQKFQRVRWFRHTQEDKVYAFDKTMFG